MSTGVPKTDKIPDILTDDGRAEAVRANPSAVFEEIYGLSELAEVAFKFLSAKKSEVEQEIKFLEYVKKNLVPETLSEPTEAIALLELLFPEQEPALILETLEALDSSSSDTE